MAANATYDRALGLIFLVLGIGAMWHAQSLQVAFAADPIGPKPFPTIVGGVLALAGAALLIRPERMAWHPGSWSKVAAVAVASIVYPEVLIPIGFVPATSLLCLVLARALGGGWVQSIIASAITAAAIFALIDVLLGLPLPRGPLGV
ncbi:tripartite tricarboxylate transporter TctB family protein [Rubellimicrobium roseum]|nr:tripartite tricarboxylate transporter TctB family protein [Rubellimicrobium roseum]